MANAPQTSSPPKPAAAETKPAQAPAATEASKTSALGSDAPKQLTDAELDELERKQDALEAAADAKDASRRALAVKMLAMRKTYHPQTPNEHVIFGIGNHRFTFGDFKLLTEGIPEQFAE